MRRCELALQAGPLTAWRLALGAPTLGVKLFLLLQKDNPVTPSKEQEGTHQAQSSGGLPLWGLWAWQDAEEMPLALTCLLCLVEPFLMPAPTAWGIRTQR